MTFKKTLFALFVLPLILITAVYAAELELIDYLKGNTAGGRFADGCEGLGDINGDGYNDFLITKFNTLADGGILYLYLGGSHPFDSAAVITWENYDNSENYCTQPFNIGDIDCDGVNDFIGAFAGEDTLKVFTNLEAFDEEATLVFCLDTTISWKGLHASGGGDNNNDGRPDFWIYPNYPLYDTLWGYSGCDLLDSIPDFKIVRSRMPDNNFMELGWEFCTTCDFNGDNIPDIVYGQYNSSDSDPSGRVCITWGGASLSESPDLIFYAPIDHAGDPEFGKDLACLGDISGDGIDDLWVSQGGRNYIYYGGQPFDTIPDWAMDYSFMYANIENIGDVNNDGWNDVGLFRDDFLINRVSIIYCYPGMDTLVDVWFSDDDYYQQMLDGETDNIGHSHSWVGDVNGDGIDDILLGARTSVVDGNDQGWAIIQSGWQEPVAVDDGPEDLPRIFTLKQNYPNPFNSGTSIEFSLFKSGVTEISIYNILGNVVRVITSEEMQPGNQTVYWDGRDSRGLVVASGIYFYKIKQGNDYEVKKMIFMK
ncbi:MAG: T9SS type A sorting domain-containing protein [Candidatus Zixiibacteriota bacterium]